MKMILAALSTLAMLGFIGTAMAAEASGKVQAIDPAARLLTLEDGTQYTLGEGVAIDALQPGTEVTVSFEEKDGMNLAEQVVPAQ